MDLVALRQATAQDHDRTEASVPLTSPELTLAGYTATLGSMYGFLHGWELWAAAHVPADLAPMLQERQRSRLLAQDLAFFHQPLPSGAATVPLGECTRAQFLGAMYVVEGSTLGGQYIAAHAEKHFGLQHGQGNAYFVGYGVRTGSMWNSFRNVLIELPDEQAGEVISAAKIMFGAFQQWMLPGGGAQGNLPNDREPIFQTR